MAYLFAMLVVAFLAYFAFVKEYIERKLNWHSIILSFFIGLASLVLVLLSISSIDESFIVSIVFYLLAFGSTFYYSRNYIIFILASIIVVSMLSGALALGYSILYFIIAFAFGILYALSIKVDYDKAKNRKSKSIEARRDVIQIASGALIILLFYNLKGFGIYTTVALALSGYIFMQLLQSFQDRKRHKKGIIHVVIADLLNLERNFIPYGTGALYLMVGTFMIIGIVKNLNLIIFGLVLLFFGDSFATIFGMYGKPRIVLPYNHSKSVIGTFAYFVIAGFFGYFLIGLWGILFAAIFAFVESSSTDIDDNISVAFAYVLFCLALPYLAVL
ncbi:MAG: hypothetical protein ACP5RP_03600 [Candidatus Micrarchaeia archaeon]